MYYYVIRVDRASLKFAGNVLSHHASLTDAVASCRAKDAATPSGLLIANINIVRTRTIRMVGERVPLRDIVERFHASGNRLIE